jgi:hypothetical protein
MGLVVLADWYDPEVMASIGFHDENTRSQWTALAGY